MSGCSFSKKDVKPADLQAKDTKGLSKEQLLENQIRLASYDSLHVDLKQWTDLNFIFDKKCLTPLLVAFERSSPKVMSLLISHGASPYYLPACISSKLKKTSKVIKQLETKKKKLDVMVGEQLKQDVHLALQMLKKFQYPKSDIERLLFSHLAGFLDGHSQEYLSFLKKILPHFPKNHLWVCI